MAVHTHAYVRSHEEAAPGCFLIRLAAGEIARQARPGQFVHVRCGDSYDPLLRRPISLHRINPATGEICLLYRVVGRGTKRLSTVKAGETLDVLGPLGNGFNLDTTAVSQESVLLGGGIGAAPLLALAEELVRLDRSVTAVLGAASSADLLAVDAFRSLGIKVIVSTDDGSEGCRGTVVDAFREWLRHQGQDTGITAFACGPHPMIKALQRLSMKENINLQVALEERMGCGLGGCLSCVCRVKEGSSVSGWKYARVCQEGPVFKGEEVLLDE